MEVRTRLVVGFAALGAVFVFWMLGQDNVRRTPAAEMNEGAVPEPALEVPIANGAIASRLRTGADREPVSTAAAPRKDGHQKQPLVPRPDESRVRIRVVARETLAPLAGIRVMLVNEPARFGTGARHSKQSQGRPDLALVTDGEGRVEYVVPAETPYQLWILQEGREIETHPVPALDAGDEHSFEISLSTNLDLVARGRVVDGESELPLANASVRRGDTQDESQASPVKTDADGSFELATASWRVERIVVELDGYATAGAEVSGDSAAPAVVRLFRSASLAAEVRRHDGTPIEGLSVRVKKPSQDWSDLEESRSAVTDANGACLVSGLAPKVSLEVVLERARTEGADPTFVQRAELVLEPGENRVWNAVVSEGASVEGFAFDEFDAPLAELEVWLLSDEDRRFNSYHEDDFESGRAFRSRTDGTGRFHFERVPPGRWWVGIGRDEEERSRVSTPVPVRVADRPVPPVTLKVWRGLHIRGEVLRPDRGRHRPEGAMQCLVHASGPSGASDYAKEDGTFDLGPLIPGTYEVKASGGRSFAWSAPHSAVAGQDGVQLVLREGGHLSGRVVDVSGNGIPKADYALTARVGKDGFSGWTDKRGAFDYRNVIPGTYDLIASSKNGGWGCLEGLEIAPGSERTGLELVLEPAATLRLIAHGATAERLSCRITRDGRPVAGAAFENMQAEVVVPAGKLELQFVASGVDDPLPPEPCSIEIAAGDRVERRVELRPRP